MQWTNNIIHTCNRIVLYVFIRYENKIKRRKRFRIINYIYGLAQKRFGSQFKCFIMYYR